MLIVRQTNHRLLTWGHFDFMLTGSLWLIKRIVKAAHLYHLGISIHLVGINDFVSDWLSDKTLIL